ncbi:MAG: ABC transporter substrate-binding protein [Prochloraceae cyanobacterium]
MHFQSRRNFIIKAGTAFLSTLALKACSFDSAPEKKETDTKSQSEPIDPQDETALYEAAKKEGELVVYMVYFTQEILNEIGAAFTAKYPGIEFKGTRNTASTIFQKLERESMAGLNLADIFATSDVGQMLQYKEEQKLLQYKPAGKDNIIEKYRDFDPDNFYQVGALLPLIIAYNSKLISPPNTPNSWKEFIDNKYKNKIATGSGAASGQVGVWAVSMQQIYGWDYIVKFNSLNPKLGRSINTVVPTLVSGERALGVSTIGQTITRKALGDPLDVIYPEEGAITPVAPIAILKKAPHPNAAKLFMNFLTSKEYSQVVARYYEQPLRFDVEVSGAKSVANIKTYTPTPMEINQNILEVKRKWRDLFGA